MLKRRPVDIVMLLTLLVYKEIHRIQHPNNVTNIHSFQFYQVFGNSRFPKQLIAEDMQLKGRPTL